LTIGAEPVSIRHAGVVRRMTGDAMGTIVPFLRGQPVFDPEALGAMSTALDQVCDALKLSQNAMRERETVAVRIVELARRGERDSNRLCERVLHEAGSR
jgi:hypothetical protein